MSRFVTLKKSDPDYTKYIWGDFSNDERALPIESLNRGTHQESTTFEIRTVESPSFFKIFYRLLKGNYFFLIFVPLYYVFVKNFVYDRLFDPTSFVLAAIASVFLFVGLNIRNDVFDHVSGFDRMIKSSRENPILLGWITARKAHSFSWMFMLASVILAIPVCLRQNEAFRVVMVTLALLLVGKFFTKNNYKFNYLSEFILFLILGPALCAGYQVSLGSGIDTEILFFGAAWGVAVLFLLYIVQFTNLFETSQGGIRNTLTVMGFDRSKVFLKMWWGLFIVLWAGYHYFYSSMYWLWFGTLILIFWSFPVMVAISHVTSPMGSALKRVRKAGMRIMVIMMIILILEQSWYLYNHLNWII